MFVIMQTPRFTDNGSNNDIQSVTASYKKKGIMQSIKKMKK